jgi:hypothetical protein
MIRTATAILLCTFLAASVLAQSACETQAVSKDGSGYVAPVSSGVATLLAQRGNSRG